MKQQLHSNPAQEMADICIEQVEEMKVLQYDNSESTTDPRKNITKLQHLIQEKLALLIDPNYRGQRIALAMIITVTLALLDGDPSPNGKWRTGG